MARGRHYAKLSLSNAARLSFSDLCILLFLFLSLCRLFVCVFLCSHRSLVDVPLIFFCPADHVPDWQPRVLLGMVEARSKKTNNNNNMYVFFLRKMWFLTFSVLVANPKKILYTVANPARGLLNNIGLGAFCGQQTTTGLSLYRCGTEINYYCTCTYYIETA